MEEEGGKDRIVQAAQVELLFMNSRTLSLLKHCLIKVLARFSEFGSQEWTPTAQCFWILPLGLLQNSNDSVGAILSIFWDLLCLELTLVSPH
jgi:hypothetical protein